MHKWLQRLDPRLHLTSAIGWVVMGFELDRADFVPASQKSPPMTLPGGRAEELVDEGVPFKEAKQRITDAFEASYLKALLDKYGGNITRSAQAAGLTRYHLRELAKRYGVRDTQV